MSMSDRHISNKFPYLRGTLSIQKPRRVNRSQLCSFVPRVDIYILHQSAMISHLSTFGKYLTFERRMRHILLPNRGCNSPLSQALMFWKMGKCIDHWYFMTTKNQHTSHTNFRLSIPCNRLSYEGSWEIIVVLLPIATTDQKSDGCLVTHLPGMRRMKPKSQRGRQRWTSRKGERIPWVLNQ